MGPETHAAPGRNRRNLVPSTKPIEFPDLGRAPLRAEVVDPKLTLPKLADEELIETVAIQITDQGSGVALGRVDPLAITFQTDRFMPRLHRGEHAHSKQQRASHLLEFSLPK